MSAQWERNLANQVTQKFRDRRAAADRMRCGCGDVHGPLDPPCWWDRDQAAEDRRYQRANDR